MNTKIGHWIVCVFSAMVSGAAIYMWMRGQSEWGLMIGIITALLSFINYQLAQPVAAEGSSQGENK